MIGKSKPNPVNVGDQIGNYTIENIIATGLNCFIYSGKLKNTITTSVAIKTEIDIPSRTALSREIIVLEAVKNQKHFAKIIETGNYKEFRFVVTDLLGPNLRDLAHRKEPHRFGLQILLKFAYQAFESLQTLHQAESTPEEDLMRVMNIISEYYTGKDQVAEMINRMSKEQRDQIDQSLKIPTEFQELNEAIINYQPDKNPDYSHFLQIIQKITMQNQLDLNQPFDWEIEMEHMRVSVIKSSTKIEQRSSYARNDTKITIEYAKCTKIVSKPELNVIQYTNVAKLGSVLFI
ncbi:MAG: hypothetical protein EZS28_003084 [Streblomastix strix]|uniref:Protein kinase domain-containing protein n=1 Tax=Streblomastix strix TaxID=222440 RepID=A0A5J4X3R0_9EUKA|nr:MAG: hypothetical protein EZS28_003084 [Streblomastix strix]